MLTQHYTYFHAFLCTLHIHVCVICDYINISTYTHIYIYNYVCPFKIFFESKISTIVYYFQCQTNDITREENDIFMTVYNGLDNSWIIKEAGGPGA